MSEREHIYQSKTRSMVRILQSSPVVPRVAVETGTFEGEFTACLAKLFSSVHTIELSRELYERRPHIVGATFHLGDSRVVLKQLAEEIKEPCLFYLDAHYWKIDRPVVGKGDHPLFGELVTLSKRPHQDVVVVDDVHAFGRKGDGWEDVLPENLAKSLGRVVHQVKAGDMHAMWRSAI